MKNRTRTEYSILNIATGIGGYILNTILGFICRMVFVRCLSADYLGVNGLFTNILTMLSLTELGIGTAIGYALYRPLAENDHDKVAALVKFYRKAYFIIGMIVALVGLALVPFLNLIIREQPNISESIYVLYLINLFNTASTYFFSYRSSLLSVAQQNYIVLGLNYCITIIQSVVQMIALVLTYNYLLYLLIQTAGIFVYNMLISYIAGKRYPYIKDKSIRPLSKDEKKSLFHNIRDLTLYKVSGLLVNSTDNILITFFKGLATTGVVSNYTLLISTLTSLVNQLFTGITASVGNHNATESNEKCHEMFLFLDMIDFWIFGWAALGIFFCSSDLVRLCFGEKYILPDCIPFILSLNFYISGSTNVIGIYKDTMGLFHYGRFIQIATGIINIISSILLGRYFGVFGILLATVIARVCTHFWYTPYVVYLYGFKKNPAIYLKKHCKHLCALFIAAFFCNVFLQYIIAESIFSIILKIVICSLIINIVFSLLFFRSPEFKKFRDTLLIILHKKIFFHKK